MPPLTRFGVLMTLTALIPGSALPQQPPHPDSMRVIIAPPAVQVRQAMVLALMGDTLLPSTAPRFAAVRAVAESLGFTFLPVLTNDLKVTDSRYHAVYSLPSDVRTGYLIIIPGHRPDLVRGFVEPDSLRRRLTHYRQLAGPLVAR